MEMIGDFGHWFARFSRVFIKQITALKPQLGWAK
jgi:hypothetical protein